MAVTINDEPASVVPGHNPLLYVLTSTNSSELDFRYDVDVYVNSVKVSTIRARNNPAGTVANVMGVVKTYLSNNYFSPGTITPYVDFQIKVGESYVDASGTTITIPDSATSSTCRAYNAALPMLEHATGIYSGYLDRFQTIRPLGEWLWHNNGENNFVCAFPTEGGGFDTVEWLFYDAPNGGGSLIDSASQSVSGCVMVNLDQNIEAESFTVQLKNGGSNVGDPLKYNIGACHPYTPLPLHFLNRLGGFETFQFRLASRRKATIDRKTAAKIGYHVDGGTVNYFQSSNTFLERGMNYANTYTEKLTITTDFLSDEVYEWLLDLMTSPLIYTEQTFNNTVYFVPCTITNTEYEQKKYINDRMTALQIDIELSVTNNTQLR